MNTRTKGILIGLGALVLLVVVFLPGIISHFDKEEPAPVATSQPSIPEPNQESTPTPEPQETAPSEEELDEYESKTHATVVPDALRNDYEHLITGIREYLSFDSQESADDRTKRLSAIFDVSTAELSLSEALVFENFTPEGDYYTIQMTQDPYVTMNGDEYGVLIELSGVAALKDYDAEGKLLNLANDQIAVTYYYPGVTNENYEAGSPIPNFAGPKD